MYIIIDALFMFIGCISVIIVAFILVISFGLATGIYYAIHTNRDNISTSFSPTTVLISESNNDPVLLPNDLPYSFDVTPTAGSGAAINVSQVPCDDLNIQSRQLDPLLLERSPINPRCAQFNYLLADTPIYLTNSSYLLYNMTLHLPGGRPNSPWNVSCPHGMVVYLLNNNISYYHLINTQCDTNGISIVQTSQCLSLGSNDTSINYLVEFNINVSDNYYVVLQTPGTFMATTYITGVQMYYNISRSYQVCLSTNGTCAVNKCNNYFGLFKACFDKEKEEGDMCTLVQSHNSNDIIVNVTATDNGMVYFTGDSAYTITVLFSLAVLFGLITILSILSLIALPCVGKCCWTVYHKRKQTIKVTE